MPDPAVDLLVELARLGIELRADGGQVREYAQAEALREALAAMRWAGNIAA